MATIAQDMLVAIIVASCAIFSAWRLMSPRLRLRMLDFVGPVATRLGAASVVSRLRSQTIGQLAGGCSACLHNKTAVHHPGSRH